MGVRRSFALRCQIPEAEAEPATVGCNPTTNLRRQLKPLIRNALRSFGLGSRSLRLSLIWKSFQLMDIPSESGPARQRNLHASSNGLLRKSDLSVRAQMNHLAQMRVRVRSKSRAHFMFRMYPTPSRGHSMSHLLVTEVPDLLSATPNQSCSYRQMTQSSRSPRQPNRSPRCSKSRLPQGEPPKGHFLLPLEFR